MGLIDLTLFERIDGGYLDLHGAPHAVSAALGIPPSTTLRAEPLAGKADAEPEPCLEQREQPR